MTYYLKRLKNAAREKDIAIYEIIDKEFKSIFGLPLAKTQNNIIINDVEFRIACKNARKMCNIFDTVLFLMLPSTVLLSIWIFW